MKVKVAQSCPTLCDPMDYTVRGILQVRLLEWAAIPFSCGSFWPRNWTGVSCIVGRWFTNWAITITLMYVQRRGFTGGSVIKNLPAMQKTQEMWVRSLERSPGEGLGNPLQYSCLENPHGQRSLAGCSPWGCKESDTTERLTLSLSR